MNMHSEKIPAGATVALWSSRRCLPHGTTYACVGVVAFLNKGRARLCGRVYTLPAKSEAAVEELERGTHETAAV